MMFASIDWHHLFAFDTPLLEIFIRGTVMYLGLFLMLRFLMNRQTGGVSITDVLVIVLLADAAQNGMAGEYQSISDGLALVGTIIFWDTALDWLSYHSPIVSRILNPNAIPVIRNGRMLKANMKRELMTQNELLSHLRGKGIEDIAQVKKACVESGGEISVITYKRGNGSQHKKKNTPGAA